MWARAHAKIARWLKNSNLMPMNNHSDNNNSSGGTSNTNDNIPNKWPTIYKSRHGGILNCWKCHINWILLIINYDYRNESLAWAEKLLLLLLLLSSPCLISLSYFVCFFSFWNVDMLLCVRLIIIISQSPNSNMVAIDRKAQKNHIKYIFKFINWLNRMQREDRALLGGSICLCAIFRAHLVFF